jgi:hypothetical protein
MAMCMIEYVRRDNKNSKEIVRWVYHETVKINNTMIKEYDHRK